MHIALRKRDTHALGIKGLLHLFIELKKHVPVVLAVHPRPADDIDAALSEFCHRNRRGRILQDPVIRFLQAVDNSFGQIDVVLIPDPEILIHPARGFKGIVRDSISEHT